MERRMRGIFMALLDVLEDKDWLQRERGAAHCQRWWRKRTQWGPGILPGKCEPCGWSFMMVCGGTGGLEPIFPGRPVPIPLGYLNAPTSLAVFFQKEGQDLEAEWQKRLPNGVKEVTDCHLLFSHLWIINWHHVGYPGPLGLLIVFGISRDFDLQARETPAPAGLISKEGHVSLNKSCRTGSGSRHGMMKCSLMLLRLWALHLSALVSSTLPSP